MNFINKVTSIAVISCVLAAIALPGVAEEISIYNYEAWSLAKRGSFVDDPEIISRGVILNLDKTEEPLHIRAPVPEDDRFVMNADSRIIFTVSGDHVAQTITGGNWRLGGILEIRFDGRYEPHEASVFPLFGPGVKSLEGRFDRVIVPNNWLYKLDYDHKAGTLRLRDVKPDLPAAFPGAEGFGKYTIGGRGGKVYEVTNLNDSGPGSLREACEASGPRTVVFRVSGTIELKSRIKIENPYITIAGQESDSFGGKGQYVVIDHCSAGWSVDETFSINKASNLTVQWCMVTESLHESIHKKGKHGYGGLWGGPGGSWHHNILAHHASRNPRASGNTESGLMDFRNNVIYNWGFNSAYGGEGWPRNWINNYYKYGPATRRSVRHRIFVQRDPVSQMYASGNFVWGYPAISADNWNGGIDFETERGASQATLRVDKPFMVAPVHTHSASEAYELVLKHAGASLVRDAVDKRIINEIRTGTARYGKVWEGGGKGILSSQKDVGGWPVLESKPAPADSDHDGMPDQWERTHGLNPDNPKDGSQKSKNSAYTNLERYLNSLVPSEK